MKKIKKILSLILLMTVLTAFGSISAHAQWLSLGIATVSEMFTERDFDPSYDKCEEIVLADGASRSESAAVRIDGDTVQISQQGVYKLSGTLSDGQIVVYAPESAKVQLVLDGVDISKNGSAAIYAVSADKVFITTAEGSENTLRSVGALEGSGDVDGAVHSKVDLCLNGWGSVSITSESGHGIVSKDDLKICSGNYQVSALKQGISGKDSIRIGGGNIHVTSGSDGLHSEHDSADKGFIFISGGDVSIDSTKDGIDCTNYFSMPGGNVSISADSDGINVAGSNDNDVSCYVSIGGGVLNIRAMEDGIDSNGSIGVSGGEIYISAAPGGGDGALDYGMAAEISGGTVAAASCHVMAANFNSAENQGSILCAFSQKHSAGEKIVLSDSEGEILSFTPELDYQAVVLSCADVASDGKYTVSAGDESVEIVMSGSIYGSLGPMGDGGFGHGRMGENPGMEDRPQPPMDFFGGGKTQIPGDGPSVQGHGA